MARSSSITNRKKVSFLFVLDACFPGKSLNFVRWNGKEGFWWVFVCLIFAVLKQKVKDYYSPSTMASSQNATPPPPPPPKESFARRYKFAWPLLLAGNLAIGGVPILFSFFPFFFCSVDDGDWDGCWWDHNCLAWVSLLLFWLILFWDCALFAFKLCFWLYAYFGSFPYLCFDLFLQFNLIAL